MTKKAHRHQETLRLQILAQEREIELVRGRSLSLSLISSQNLVSATQPWSAMATVFAGGI